MIVKGNGFNERLIAESEGSFKSKNERRRQLVEVLNRRDVPFPIDPETAQLYLGDFENDVPFGTGC